MTFGEAIEKLKIGHHITRSGWNGKNMYLGYQAPDKNSKMTLPYIYMVTADKNKVPWLASQTDILANDWSCVCPCEKENHRTKFEFVISDLKNLLDHNITSVHVSAINAIINRYT